MRRGIISSSLFFVNVYIKKVKNSMIIKKIL